MPSADAASRYIHLAFMISRLFPGYVDAYYGPGDLEMQALSGDTPPIGALDDLASSIAQSLETDHSLAEDRRLYLEEELRAMRTTIRILNGAAPDIVEEVSELYGVTPVWVDESVFTEAQRKLDDLLPGPDPLARRVQAYRERSRVSTEVALDLMHHLFDDFRARTQRLFGLPPNESCELSTVSDKPWRAYNWYLGQNRSRIDLNLDFPRELWEVPIIVAHEAYPGHHTEHAIKENKLYLGQGRLEHAIALSNTPSALISEGIAKNALHAILSDAELAALYVDLYARAGLPPGDAYLAPAFVEASDQLDRVSDNQILLMYRDHARNDEVIDYGMRHALTSKEDETRTLRFYQDPLSRSYTYNYTLGSQLVAQFLARSKDKTKAFYLLLSEPVTPTQLQAAIARK